MQIGQRGRRHARREGRGVELVFRVQDDDDVQDPRRLRSGCRAVEEVEQMFGERASSAPPPRRDRSGCASGLPRLRDQAHQPHRLSQVGVVVRLDRTSGSRTAAWREIAVRSASRGWHSRGRGYGAAPSTFGGQAVAPPRGGRRRTRAQKRARAARPPRGAGSLLRTETRPGRSAHLAFSKVQAPRRAVHRADRRPCRHHILQARPSSCPASPSPWMVPPRRLPSRVSIQIDYT